MLTLPAPVVADPAAQKNFEQLQRYFSGALPGTVIRPGSLPGKALTPGSAPSDFFAPNSVPGHVIIPGTLETDKLIATDAVIQFLDVGILTADLMDFDIAMGNKVLANLTLSDNITANGLQAISAAMGTLTSGTILVQGGSGAKVALGDNLITTAGAFDGILAADASGNVTLKFDIATGTLQLKGDIQTGSTGLGNISGAIHGTTNVQPNTLNGDRLTIDTIGVRELNGFEITALDLTVGSATAGQLTATAIDGMTITGATIQTAASGRRILMDTSYLRTFDGSGNQVLQAGGSDGAITFAVASGDTADRRITWLSGATLLGNINCWGTTSDAQSVFNTLGSNSAVHSIGSSSASRGSFLAVDTYESSASQTITRIYCAASGSGTKTIVNGLGESSFLQLASIASHTIAFGTSSLNFSANNDTSVTAAHGLGVTPQYVVVTPRSSGGSSIAAPACSSRDATNITISARTYNGSNATMSVTVDWVAIA